MSHRKIKRKRNPAFIYTIASKCPLKRVLVWILFQSEKNVRNSTYMGSLIMETAMQEQFPSSRVSLFWLHRGGSLIMILQHIVHPHLSVSEIVAQENMLSLLNLYTTFMFVSQDYLIKQRNQNCC